LLRRLLHGRRGDLLLGLRRRRDSLCDRDRSGSGILRIHIELKRWGEVME
jgi:hypothetical protein